MRPFVLMLVFGCSFATFAAETVVKPGLWQVKREPSVSPSGPKLEITYKACITNEMAGRNQTPELYFGPECEVKNHEREGRGYRVEMVCKSMDGNLVVVTKGEFLDDITFSSISEYNTTKGLQSARYRGKWMDSDCGDVRPINAAVKAKPQERPYPDLAMASRPKDHPSGESIWQTTERARYERLLTLAHVDVLVVPYQVQEYAFDRPTRSLMTVQLASALTTVHSGSVAEPYLVSRALGEGKRRIKQDEIYRLSDKLKVKRIIWAYVGHNRKGLMTLTIQFQDRAADGSLDAVGKISKRNFKNLAFSDEKPAIEVHEAILPKVIDALGIDASALGNPKAKSRFDTSVFPQSPIPVATRTPEPARDAYHLQILGALTPHPAERTRERFFEKSLLAVAQMSPRSPQYRALKARAYMHLGLRPVAVALVAKPATMEEKALLAALNGDLPRLDSLVKQIRSPVIALFARLDLHDMRFQYEIESKKKSHQESEALVLPGLAWLYLKERAFTAWDVWTQHENLLLKKELDREFPIDGFDVDSILRSSIVLGKVEEIDAQIALSVTRHVERLMELRSEKWCCNPPGYAATERDYVDLLESIGTTNLLRKANFYIHTQGSYRRAMEFLDRMVPAYQDHPAFLLARAETQEKLSASAAAKNRNVLLKSARENSIKAYHWEQAATKVAEDAVRLQYSGALRGLGSVFNPYAADLPPKVSFPHWELSWRGKFRSEQRQVKIFEIALKYSTTEFRGVWHQFLSIRDDSKTEALLRSINNRFLGNPVWGLFIAQYHSSKGDVEAAKKDYRSSIVAQPGFWPAYEGLGEILVHEGHYEEAAKLFIDFPRFKLKEPEEPVTLSNYAYDAGSLLYWRGAIDEAIPLYKIAADLRTGSAASMASEIRLALLDKDFARAAAGSLQRATRYGSTYAYRDYLGLLHLLGYRKEAWDSFAALVHQFPKSPHVWETVLVGHRLENRSESEITAWAKQRHLARAGNDSSHFAARYLVRAGVTDRIPSKELSAAVAEIEGNPIHMELPGRLSAMARNRHVGRRSSFAPHKVMTSDLVYFLEAYSAMRRQDFALASKTFREASATFDMSLSQFRYLLPYYALAAAKAGDVAEVTKVLAKMSKSNDFDYYLARAVIAAIDGKTEKALKSLKNSLNRRPFTEDRPIFVEYQYGEICEWLFEITKQAEYREVALDWAKKNQRIQPWHAWAYVMEAKLTESPADRQRALGIALNLDKNSERLKSFTKEERDVAIKEFEQNNPFKVDNEPRPKTGV